MTEDEACRFITERFDDVRVVTASEETGAPEVAWGDRFFFYDPDGSHTQRMPFATIVTKDYPDFDDRSNLNRPGVFRLNIAISQATFRSLFGDPKAMEHHSLGALPFDYTELDRVMPHPVYRRQSWVCVLNPGPASTGLAETLLVEAHERAAHRLAAQDR